MTTNEEQKLAGYLHLSMNICLCDKEEMKTVFSGNVLIRQLEGELYICLYFKKKF